MIEKVVKTRDVLWNQMERRYKMEAYYDMSRGEHIDRFFPHAMVQNNTSAFHNLKYGKTMSEFISASTGAKLMSAHEWISKVGYTQEQIIEYMDKVREKMPSIFMIGFGGTGTNLLYRINQMVRDFDQKPIFKKVAVYDDDEIEITNIPRIPYNLQMYKGRYKAYIPQISDMASILHQQLTYNVMKMNRPLANFIIGNNENVVFVGAPDLETRDTMSNRNFIAITHQNDDIDVTVRPTGSSDSLVTETYGMIDLGIFFINQAWASIKFLELLANHSDEHCEVDESLNDKPFSYSYKEV